MFSQAMQDMHLKKEIITASHHFLEKRFNDKFGKSNYCGLCVQIETVDGRLIHFMASGESPKRSIARKIAVAEALERLGHYIEKSKKISETLKCDVIKSDFLTTSGCCFHTSWTNTLYGAYKELIERDEFLCCWYSDAPLPCSFIDSTHPLNDYYKKFSEENWILREHYFHENQFNIHVSVLTLTAVDLKRKWKFFIGLGSGLTYEEASYNALIEILRFYWFYANSTIDPQSPLNTLDPTSGQYRFFANQMLNAIEAYNHKLKASTPCKLEVNLSNVSKKAFIKKFTELVSAKITPLPIFSAFKNFGYNIRVTTSTLQLLNYGLKPEINSKRIFEKYGTNEENLYRVPHPIA